MRRREFIALIAAGAVWPGFSRGETKPVPTIGFLHTAAAPANRYLVAAFLNGLKDFGFVDGRNMTVQYRWAEGHYDRLRPYADELVGQRVSLIIAGGGTAPAESAKAATTSIPIVFVTGDDPVQAGLVASLNKPPANMTGIAFFNSDLAGKRLQLLREIVPGATTIAFLVNPASHEAAPETKLVQLAARDLNVKITLLNATTLQELHDGFARLKESPPDALLLAADPFFGSQRHEIVALAARAGLPFMAGNREYVVGGGLISYGTSIPEAYRQAGIYAGRILRGASPSDLPVMQSTKFDLIVNLKTAAALGIAVPPTLLARADEVVE